MGICNEYFDDAIRTSQVMEGKLMNKTFEKFGANTMNRFYMGAEHIGNAIAKGRNSSYTKATLEEVVEEARKTLAKDHSKECQIIVEIIAVVYREDPPVHVDYLKDK